MKHLFFVLSHDDNYSTCVSTESDPDQAASKFEMVNRRQSPMRVVSRPRGSWHDKCSMVTTEPLLPRSVVTPKHALNSVQTQTA
jgi:hypothetical protein